MSSQLLTTTFLTLAASVWIASNARAVVDADNLGRWTQPTETGPDKECPGFLVNLGPTAAMVLALGTDKARLRIQGMPSKPQL